MSVLKPKLTSDQALEIAETLVTRNDYVLFGSFAGHLLTGADWSPDIDVLMRGPDEMRSLSAKLVSQGWYPVCGDKGSPDNGSQVMTLSQGEFSVDICHYPALTSSLFASRTLPDFCGMALYCISPEMYFLLKLNHLAMDLDPVRTQRDRGSILQIRQLLETDRLQQACLDIGQRFWLEGRL